MTGEQRPRTTSRITDALLPTRPPEPAPEPLAVETTTRLRAIRPSEEPPPRPATPSPSHPHPATGSTTPPRPTAAPARPVAGPPRPAPTHPTSGRPASDPGAQAPAPPAPPRPATRPAPADPPGAATPQPAAPRPTPAPAASAPARPGPAPQAPLAASAPARPAPAPWAPAAAPPARPVPPRASTPGTPHGTPGGLRTPGFPPPEVPVEITTRLRPVRERRTGRTVAVAVCAVLGAGLIGGALAGVWMAAAEPGKPAEPAGYTETMDLWHNAPVDTLFPRTLAGPGAGPGGAARTWTRIVVAPDTACTPAVLAKGLLATLRPLGCERVLRATYTDATASGVITVGLVFTRADVASQRTLAQGAGGLTARLGEDVPPALPGPGTVAAGFGAKQRAGWWLSAPADLPVVVTAVSGFADGRAVDRPQPADRAMAKGRTDATAQSGLGHEAKNITIRFERLLRTTAAAAAKEKNAR
ncbi:hypothetical protein [Streptomyces sp. Qhu_M48]|uniref:hypothetical protein n=1 Tax=Streptomyces sp. Qhu_M48 TaxID=3435889 RepID=UPI003F505235